MGYIPWDVSIILGDLGAVSLWGCVSIESLFCHDFSVPKRQITIVLSINANLTIREVFKEYVKFKRISTIYFFFSFLISVFFVPSSSFSFKSVHPSLLARTEAWRDSSSPPPCMWIKYPCTWPGRFSLSNSLPFSPSAEPDPRLGGWWLFDLSIYMNICTCNVTKVLKATATIRLDAVFSETVPIFFNRL